MKRIVVAGLFAFCACGSRFAFAQDAPIEFATLGTVTDPADVLIGGPVIEAQYAGGSGAQTVNGVTFADGFTDYAAAGGTFTGALDGKSTGNAEYDTILNDFAYDGTNPGVLTLTGLTAGTAYTVELWSLDDRDDTDQNEYERTVDFSDVAGNTSATFTEGSNTIITGLFTADASTEIVDVNGVASYHHNLNAFQVFEVPEPGTRAAVILGSLGLLRMMLRRGPSDSTKQEGLAAGPGGRSF